MHECICLSTNSSKIMYRGHRKHPRSKSSCNAATQSKRRPGLPVNARRHLPKVLTPRYNQSRFDLSGDRDRDKPGKDRTRPSPAYTPRKTHLPRGTTPTTTLLNGPEATPHRTAQHPTASLFTAQGTQAAAHRPSEEHRRAAEAESRQTAQAAARLLSP